MTKNEILTELFLSKDFCNCISKMDPEHLQDDLKSDVMLILCEYPEEKIIGLWERKQLKYFAVRIILNSARSKTSRFHYRFRAYATDEFTDAVNVPEDTGYAEKSMLQDMALREIDNLYWYDKEIVKLYIEHGTYRAVERVTNIPWESIYKTVQRSCKLIREKVTA